MRQRVDGAWEVRQRRAPVVRSLAAAGLLAVVGAVVGGLVGWVSFLFFSAGCVALMMQLAGRRAVAAFDANGVVVARSKQQVALTPWADVEAILLWTRPPAAGSRVDLLGVVTSADLPSLATYVEAVGAGGASPIDPERSLSLHTPLIDCRLDAYELRTVLLGFGSRAVVVDRRI